MGSGLVIKLKITLSLSSHCIVPCKVQFYIGISYWVLLTMSAPPIFFKQHYVGHQYDIYLYIGTPLFTRLRVFKLLYCAAVVGLTAAQSKTALCNWLDALVTGITTVDPRVYNCAGAREDGMYHKLKQTEFARILAQISNLNQWGAQCSESIPPVSCGPFYMIIPGGRGGITLEQVFCGPFISQFAKMNMFVDLLF